MEHAQMIEHPLPVGLRFLSLALSAEAACEQATRTRLATLGEKAPVCHDNLGTILSLLYAEACCTHGCAGGDHFGQRLAGRVFSRALGSYRLPCAGYYDESLALSRNLGEIANLLWLFRFCPEEQERWRSADKRTRLREFSPVKVRLFIEATGQPVPVDKTRYAGLCDIAVHVGPETSPQVYNSIGLPTVGAVFQEGGCLVSLNELAVATGVCVAGLIPLLTLEERRQRLRESSVALLRSVGGVDLEKRCGS
jgi:hypothetical protein